MNLKQLLNEIKRLKKTIKERDKMKAKELIQELKKLNENDEVILWEWIKDKSVYSDLVFTTNPIAKKGYITLRINQYNPLKELNKQ